MGCEEEEMRDKNSMREVGGGGNEGFEEGK